MDSRILIEKTKDFVKKTLENEGTGHDWWHIERVLNTAKHIAKEEGGADTFIVELAALLHDIADWKFNGGKTETGVKKSREWLESLGVEEKIISTVCNIVENISFKGAEVKSKIKTKEGKIVQDADRLDALGAIGIARTFAYGGFAKREIHNPNMKPRLAKTFDEYKGNKSTSINHFYEKVLLLKDLMNTKTGKKLAERRHKFVEVYLKQFFDEWEGKI